MSVNGLRPYPAYRDSGVEWLGKVPEHWELRRGKTVFRCIDERSETGSEELLTVSSDRGIVPRDSTSVTMFKARSYVGHKLCWPGDLVINSLWAWSRGLGVSRYHGIVSTAYGVYRARRKARALPDFIHALVRSEAFNWELRVRSKGIWISRLQLTDDSFLSAPLPLPPISEQGAIIRFLNAADRRIRRYIRAKERLIELLEERKRALIHEAVTGRIDVRTGQPYPAYKDSGVEWLGKVPEHWEVAALRHLATKFGSGVTPRGGATVYEAKGIPLLRSQNVHFDGLRLEGVARIPPDLHLALKGTHVKPRDVLLNITGASIGRVCTVPDDLSDANVNQHVCIIRPRSERILPDLLATFLSIPGMQETIELEQVGASRQGLTLDSIRSFKVFVPPALEQAIIVEAVHGALDRIDLLASVARRQIALLHEYRTRLIADVVTGKLDVRETAARLPETDPLAGDRERADAIPTTSNLPNATW